MTYDELYRKVLGMRRAVPHDAHVVIVTAQGGEWNVRDVDWQYDPEDAEKKAPYAGRRQVVIFPEGVKPNVKL